MKAAPLTDRPAKGLMKQTDVQNFYHLQMPRWLFSDDKYTVLSLEAKVAYMFLLNRFQLSKLNGWVNEQGEVFIIYTRKSLAKEMRVSYRKIIESMQELTKAGLIWEKRCGRGAANQIYLIQVDHETENRDHQSVPFVEPGHESAAGRSAGTAPQKPDESEPAPSRNAGTAPQEMPDSHLQKCGDSTSRDATAALQEVPDAHPSKIEKRDTDGIYIDVSQSVCGKAPPGKTFDRRTDDEQEELDEILDACSLWIFSKEVAVVFENAIERLYFAPQFTIGGVTLPQKRVRARLRLLDAVILQTVESKMHSNLDASIKNSTAYTMSVIFNAISESESDLMIDPYLNSLRQTPPLRKSGEGG